MHVSWRVTFPNVHVCQDAHQRPQGLGAAIYLPVGRCQMIGLPQKGIPLPIVVMGYQPTDLLQNRPHTAEAAQAFTDEKVPVGGVARPPVRCPEFKFAYVVQQSPDDQGVSRYHKFFSLDE